MRRMLLALFVLGVAGACVRNIGVRADQMTVATSPAGAHSEIRLVKDGSWLRGELLETRDSALVVLGGGLVTVVPLSTIDRATFDDGMIYLSNQDRLSANQLSELRLVSRYPSGITSAVMAKLLAAQGQTEPVVIAR